jgi:predicted nucleic acid-binding protein
MKGVLFDTNVVLDVLLKRSPWDTNAATCWQACDDGKIRGCLAASTLTDIFYIARKQKGLADARAAVRVCLDAFAICVVDRQALESALSLDGNDFEDNLQISCATFANLDIILTRDKGGFTDSTIPVLSPDEFVIQL